MRANPDPWQRAFYLPLTILAWLAVLVIGGWLLTHLTKTILLLVLSAVLAFLMEFIPVLGVFITGMAAVLIGLFVGWERALLALGFFVVVHVIEADVVGPRILGQAVGIHPATGLIALLAGTELFGIWGALFAAPLAGLLQAIGTAAWLELRGGDPQPLVRAVADREQEKVERRVGVEPPRDPARAAPRDSAAP